MIGLIPIVQQNFFLVCFIIQLFFLNSTSFFLVSCNGDERPRPSLQTGGQETYQAMPTTRSLNGMCRWGALSLTCAASIKRSYSCRCGNDTVIAIDCIIACETSRKQPRSEPNFATRLFWREYIYRNRAKGMVVRNFRHNLEIRIIWFGNWGSKTIRQLTDYDFLRRKEIQSMEKSFGFIILQYIFARLQMQHVLEESELRESMSPKKMYRKAKFSKQNPIFVVKTEDFQTYIKYFASIENLF